jgi:hypothetical protein
MSIYICLTRFLLECHIRYYNNYLVQNAVDPLARRKYYLVDPPQFIQVTESAYVEPELCNYFALQMAQSQ